MSIFVKNSQSFLVPPKKIWAALKHSQQKLQFSDSISVIKILIVNQLDIRM